VWKTPKTSEFCSSWSGKTLKEKFSVKSPLFLDVFGHTWDNGKRVCALDRFKNFFFLELRLRLWIFFSLGSIETMFRKYTFHKNRFFYPHRAKNGQKMAKNGQKKFWPKNFGFFL